MRPGRIVALVIGCLLLLPSIAMLASGAALGAASAFARDDDGYFSVDIDPIESPAAAVVTEDIDFMTEPGTPDWVIDRLDADVRLRVTPLEPGQEVFVGIAPADDLDGYLTGVEHDEIIEIDGDRPVYRRVPGDATIDPPADQDFWTISASGAGVQELRWEATEGRWAAAIVNVAGEPGVVADVEVGAKAGFVLPLAITLGGLGLVLTLVAVALIVIGATKRRPAKPMDPPDRAGLVQPPQPAPMADDQEPHAVSLRAALEPNLSRWMWLVKWILAIPHFIVLVFLWIAFTVTTIVAGVAILFTGRYPRGIFDFNVGVLRWSWRVSHYATTGGLGTDRYPPFRLEPSPDDAARLDIRFPAQLSRGLVLVKWWLLALPHYLVLALLFGAFGWDGDGQLESGGGLVALLSIFAGFGLLFTGSLPRPLFGLIVGFNRWMYRVIAYAALMTDEPHPSASTRAEPNRPHHRHPDPLNRQQGRPVPCRRRPATRTIATTCWCEVQGRTTLVASPHICPQWGTRR